jgi:molybdopterin-containing oxidoreductase family molybdopterin binding subunit
MWVHVRDGKIVKTSKYDCEDPHMTRICQRGLSHAQRVYAPERIKYPLRRAGERGADEWEQITWDEAIAEICTKWKEIQATYGAPGIAFLAGTGNAGPDQYYVQRLGSAMGASRIYPMADMNGLYMAALMVTRGPYLHGNSANSVLDSKTIFMWSNATTSDHARWAYVQAALDKGAKLVVIDPNFTLAASKADLWVPIRPATDAAFLMAVTKIIIDEGLQDTDYLTKGTVAPFLVKESDGKYLRYSDLGLAEAGEGGGGIKLDGAASEQAAVDDGSNPIVVMGANGVHGSRDEIADPVLEGSFDIDDIKVSTAYTLLKERIAEWTPEAASELCQVPVETITEVAHLYVDGPTMNYVGFGMDHWVQGPWPYHALFTLAGVAGNFGKKGSGISGQMGGSSMGITGFSVGGGMTPPNPIQGPVVYSQGLTELLDTGSYMGFPLTIKSLFVTTGNPAAGQSNRKAFLRFVETLDLLVVCDSVMSDTVRIADYVLPVPHWFEFETAINVVQPFLRISEQAIAPLYESKRDIDICNLLGEGMGLGDQMGLTAEEFLSACMSGEEAQAMGLSLEKLRAEKTLRLLPDDFVFGENYQLPTPTGKLEFYIENPAQMIPTGAQLDTRLLALPHWEPPIEAWPSNPQIEQYPLTFMSHRDKARVNSMFCYSPWLEDIFPEPTLDLNPVDAQPRGIQTGDTVKAFNDRGYVVMRARVNPAIRPGIVDTARSSNGDRYIEGHASDVTTDAFNDLVSSISCNDTLVQVEKA